LCTHITFIKLRENAIVPQKAHESDAGFDLYAYDESTVLQASNRCVISTQIAIEVPSESFYARLESRSGNTLKLGFTVEGGIIDSGYTGDIGVILYNHTNEDILITHGMKIAQLIVQRHESCLPVVIQDDYNYKRETSRGSNGYGSTDNLRQ
jgi:dUTP pyrophosphatase